MLVWIRDKLPENQKLQKLDETCSAVMNALLEQVVDKVEPAAQTMLHMASQLESELLSKLTKSGSASAVTLGFSKEHLQALVQKLREMVTAANRLSKDLIETRVETHGIFRWLNSLVI